MISIDVFQTYWDAASRSAPTIIVGAGRWGRVWFDVLHNARQSHQNIRIVARSNYAESLVWCADKGYPVNCVYRDIDSAFDGVNSQETFAIIASRPSSHCLDLSIVSKYSVPVLVEKPFTHKAHLYENQLTTEVISELPYISIGTEFRFLPEIHLFSKHLKSKNICSVSIDWCDPLDDFRYSSLKRRHDEIHIIDDLIYHVNAILESLLGIPSFIVEANLYEESHANIIIYVGAVRCNIALSWIGRERVRRVQAFNSEGILIGSIDFSGSAPKLSFSSESHDHLCPHSFNSTLRLQYGWFLGLKEDQAEIEEEKKYISRCLELHKKINLMVG